MAQPATIYTTKSNLGSITKLLGSTIQSFPSGLFRVELTLIARKSDADFARLAFGIGQPIGPLYYTPLPPGSPGERRIEPNEDLQLIRNAAIFPQPREINDVPGFTKFIVSAYGAGPPTEFNYSINKQIVVLQKGYTQPNESNPEESYTWSITEKWLVDNITTTGVVERESDGVAGRDVRLDFNLLNRVIQGNRAPGGTAQIAISWQKQIVSLTRRNFGRWHEYDLTEAPIPFI